jgi:elongation factor G
VDSSDMAFQTAGALALRDAAAKIQIALLEPVDSVDITVSDEFTGGVLSDLSGRRGRVLGTEPDSLGRTLIHAEVPETELGRYPVELRSLSHGTGLFTRHYLRHDPMPSQLAAKVVEAQVG